MVLICFLLLAAAAQAAPGYLVGAGPTPLRFAVAPSTAAETRFVWPPLYPESGSRSNQVERAVGEPAPAQKQALPSEPAPAPATTNASASELPSRLEPLPAEQPGTTFTPESSTVPGADLPAVAPQRLIELLKALPGQPGSQSTNHPAAPEVLFLPPLPNNRPAGEAIYRTP